MFKKIFINTFHREEEELLLHPPEKGFDLKTFVILFWAALGLAIIKYYGDPLFFANVTQGLGLTNLADGIREWTDSGNNSSLHHLAWWVGTLLLVYLFVPVLLIKLLFKEELSNYGLKWKGAFKDWWLYVVMLVIMLPLVVYFSSTTSFQSRYPFYSPQSHENLWPKFWIWEMMYFAQFIGLEFFFRGFMTLGLRKRFGFYSIFIMTIPYCMIHFGKPMPETIGAIGAGLVLGTLSMKSRSIFMGVMIHYSVAITMDLCALWRKGFFH
ncbi:MAG: CPBP family intramembrane metalloprotease [Bacteroidetes bacterium]|nr:CPBP family intramembrane metalloprotease [Bacteroidota bacterium]